MNNPYQKHIIKLQGKEFITFKGLLAIARALRLYTGCGYTALEELGER